MAGLVEEPLLLEALRGAAPLPEALLWPALLAPVLAADRVLLAAREREVALEDGRLG
jgi:hypothetical protein